jgi:hypothetical protein
MAGEEGRVRLAAALPIFLTACQASDPTDFTQPLKDCVAASVPQGRKVSAERAHKVLQSCQPQVRAFAFGSTKQAYGKRFDPRSPRIRQEYEDRKKAIEEMMLLELSDEIKPRQARM